MPIIQKSALRSLRSLYRLVVSYFRCYDSITDSSLYYPYLGFDLQTYHPPESTSVGIQGWDTLVINSELWVTWTTWEQANHNPFTNNYHMGPWVAKWDGAAFVLVGDQLETEWIYVRPIVLEDQPSYLPYYRRNPILSTDGTDVFCVYELVMNVEDQTGTGLDVLPNTLYRCRRWTGTTWELYGEINPQNPMGAYAGATNVDWGLLLSPPVDRGGTMPPQCVADAGNVYTVWSEEYRDPLDSSLWYSRMRLATFDGTAPPVPGDGDGGTVTDIDTSDKVIVFHHGAVPPNYAPWYAIMLNSTGPVVFYVQYDVVGITQEQQIRVWSLAGGALGTIPATDFDNLSGDFGYGPRISSTTEVVSGTEMVYMAGQVGFTAVVLVEVEAPTVTHHLTADPAVDNSHPAYAGFSPYAVFPDGNNIWMPGGTGIGELMAGFSDACVMPFWGSAAYNGSISTFFSWTSMRGQLWEGSLWFGDVTNSAFGVGEHGYFTLRELPILRCVGDCRLCTDAVFQFFRTTDPPYDPPGPVDWDAFNSYNTTKADTMTFYIDGVLVTTATPPDVNGDFFYGNAAPGTIDLSTLSDGLHEMTVCAIWSYFGVSCCDTATIRVGPPPSTKWNRLHHLVDGHEIANGNITADNVSVFDFFNLGSNFSGLVNEVAFDNMKVGSTLGGSDLFSATFASAIVPPFDSVTGSGISATGGQMVISNGGTNAYATKDASTWDAVTYPELYFQFELTIDASEFAAGGFTGDFLELWIPTASYYAGIWIDTDTPGGGTGIWQTDYGDDGTTVTSGVTYTIVFHLSQT